MGRDLTCLVVCILAGCGDRQVVAITDGLPDSVTRVGLIIVGADDKLNAATGLLPLPDARAIPIDNLQDGDELFVVGFSDSDLAQIEIADEARLRSQPIRFATPLDRGVLPPPTWSGRAIVEGEQVELSSQSAPVTVTADWAPRCGQDACALVPYSTPRLFEIGEERAAAFAVIPWDAQAERALVTVGSQFFEVDERGAIPLVGLSTGTLYTSGGLLPDERMFLLGPSGLAIGRPESGFEPVPGGEALYIPQQVDVSRGEAPAEAFIATADGKIVRWTDAGLETVTDLALPETNADVVWLGPEEAIVSFDRADVIVHYNKGQTTKYDLSLPTALGWVLGIGVVVGAGEADKALYRFTASGFERMDAYAWSALYATRDIYELDETRFLFGGSRGEYAYYVGGVGICVLPTFAFRTFNQVARIRSGLVVALGTGDMLEAGLVAHLPFKEVPLACPQ